MKKTLSILLTVIMIVTTISVLAIIPAVADPTTPVNLIVNGDFEQGNWTAQNFADSQLADAGLVRDNKFDAYGWYTYFIGSSVNTLTDVSQGAAFINYSTSKVMPVTKWQQAYQDIEIEENKTYTLTASYTSTPSSSQISGAHFEMRLEPVHFGDSSLNNTYQYSQKIEGTDWNLYNGHTDEVAANDAYFAQNKTYTNNNTTYYWSGDFRTSSLTFKSNDFISAYSLSKNANGKYNCRVMLNSYSNYTILIDDVSMYETVKISKTDGGYINKDSVKVGEEATITATPYYGNAFLGWYDDNDALFSEEQTVTGYFTKNLTAKFAIYNQIVDGNFESGTDAGIKQVTSAPRWSSIVINPTLETPTGSTAANHGNYCLELNPASSDGSVRYMISYPVTVEKNKNYIFTYSIFYLDSASATPSFQTYLSPSASHADWATCGKYPALGTNFTFNFNSEKDGITSNNWGWFGSASAYSSSFTVNNASNVGIYKTNEWSTVRYMFDSGSNSALFGENDTATIYMNIGYANSATYDIRLDNIFFGEVATSIMGCSADMGGTIVGSQNTSKPTPMYFKSTAGGSAFGATDKNTSYYPVMASEAQNVTAKAYYGNTFLGWYEGNTKISDAATIKDNGTKDYVAKFINTNQIPDGDFEAGTGVSEWQTNEKGGAFSFEAAPGITGNGIIGASTGDSLSAARMPITVKKNGSYKMQFNMHINSYAASPATSVPVWLLYVATNGDAPWGSDPTLARYSITFKSTTDPSKQLNVTEYNTRSNTNAKQIGFKELEDACGTGWLEVTLELDFGEDTTQGNVANIFANSDMATVYLALGYNKTVASVTYDNISFYEDIDLVSFSHKENVRPYRVGIGPVAAGNEYKFGVDTGAASVTVKHNGTPVNATDGVYTVTLADTNNIVITADNDSEYPEMGKDLNGNSLKEYNHELYTTPKIWEGDTVYHENAVFYKERNEVKLLYPISDIISVRSFDLQTYYVEGVDFEVTAEGALKILPGSKIPVYAHTPTNTEIVWNDSDTEGTYITQYSGGSVYPCTLSITYKHAEKWADGYQGAKQTSVEDQLFDLFQKLRNGEDVHVVFYGDSMTSGWSASGGKTDVYTTANNGTTDESGIYMAPYMPNWMTLFMDGLKKIYPDANITWENLSLGGKNSDWGAANFDARYELLSNKDIDLFLIGFGINDCGGGVTKDAFKANTESIISKLRAKCSDAAVLLYGGNSTNTDAKIYDKDTLLSYEEALFEIAAATENTAATSFTSIYFDVAKSKESSDLFENNLNHANDFGCRIYAHTMLGAMSKKYTSTAATPAAPDVNAAIVAKRSVTLPAIAGNEYSMDGVNWQDSNIFTGLEPDTQYTFYQRVKRTDTVFESEKSPAATIKTLAIIYTLGDVNNDTLIDSDDAVLVLQKFEDKLSAAFTEEQELAADVNKDGTINGDDALQIIYYTIGYIDSFN